MGWMRMGRAHLMLLGVLLAVAGVSEAADGWGGWRGGRGGLPAPASRVGPVAPRRLRPLVRGRRSDRPAARDLLPGAADGAPLRPDSVLQPDEHQRSVRA